MLVAGTDSESVDNEILEIMDSPPPKRSRQNISIFSRTKEEFSVGFGDVSHNSALRTQRQNKIQPSVEEIVPPKVNKKKPLFKRPIMSDSDDDDEIQIVENEPKKSKTVKEAPKKQAKEVLKRPKEPVKTSISNQPKPAQKTTLFSLKRRKTEEESDDEDLFSFEKHQNAVVPPKIRNVKRNEQPDQIKPSLSSASISSNISVDETLDLTPGREINSTPWLSKTSLVDIKKEEPSDSIDETETKSIFNVVHLNPNETADTSERCFGKAFKKKVNYMPQTKVIEQKFIDWNDADLLYPPKL